VNSIDKLVNNYFRKGKRFTSIFIDKCRRERERSYTTDESVV
jgi:hypothetical protein